VGRDSYYGKIQDKDEEYYMQFNLVICGLDSIEARRWINATLVSMVDPENEDSVKPFIDGGTEGLIVPVHARIAHLGLIKGIRLVGFRGQSRVIIPTITSCYECDLSFPAE
jgi:NEDD8-activating enzyme E1